jgi:hypothetical protein
MVVVAFRESGAERSHTSGSSSIIKVLAPTSVRGNRRGVRNTSAQYATASRTRGGILLSPLFIGRGTFEKPKEIGKEGGRASVAIDFGKMSLSPLFLPMFALMVTFIFCQTVISNITHFAIFGVDVKICGAVNEFGVTFGIAG